MKPEPQPANTTLSSRGVRGIRTSARSTPRLESRGKPLAESRHTTAKPNPKRSPQSPPKRKGAESERSNMPAPARGIQVSPSGPCPSSDILRQAGNPRRQLSREAVVLPVPETLQNSHVCQPDKYGCPNCHGEGLDDMKCPHCGHEINPAALLGAMGKGVRKQFSAAERKRRAARMAEARKARWCKPANDQAQ